MLETDAENVDTTLEDRYIIMGFDQGQVIIFDVTMLDNGLISRHYVCRNKILMIREIEKFGLYLFYEETHVMRLCNLTKNGT